MPNLAPAECVLYLLRVFQDDESKYEAGYFQSYSWVGIHEEMIKDRARTYAAVSAFAFTFHGS